LDDGHQPGADVDLGDDSRPPARIGERGKCECSDGDHERKACPSHLFLSERLHWPP
jgi:hypothetical protein